MIGQAVVVSPVADTPREAAGERLGRLFDQHQGRLYSLARRMSGSPDAACDLVQETFLRAARSAASIPDGVSHEEAWLVRVLVNICRDDWRKQAVRRRAVAEQIPMIDPRASESALIAKSTIWRALQALPARRRAILVLYEIEGEPIPGIARLLGVRPVTVRWHLSVGRRELAKAIGISR